MPHDGILYLLFFGVVIAAGLPLVVLAEKLWGKIEERDTGIWSVVVLAALGGVWWLAA